MENMRPTKNIRIWIYRNGPVKLTLPLNKSVEIHNGGLTDEGFSSSSDIFKFVGDKILSEHHVSGRDCDGSYDYDWYGYTTLDRIQEIEDDEDEEVSYPAWTKCSEHEYFSIEQCECCQKYGTGACYALGSDTSHQCNN